MPKHWDLYLEIDRIAKTREIRYRWAHLWEVLSIDHFFPQTWSEGLKFSIALTAIALVIYTHWMYDLRAAVLALFLYANQITHLF